MNRCSLRSILMSSLLTSSLLLLTLPASHASAQEESEQGDVEELKKQVESLKKEQLRIRKDLNEIKKRLAAQKPAPRKDPSQGKLVKVVGPFKGKPDARLTLIEFSDYQ